MRRNLTIRAIAAVLLLAFSCLLAPVASAPMPPAGAPAWQKGDAWAMGSDFDWGQQLAGPIQNLTQALGATSVSFDQLDLSATGGSWIVFRVTDANETEYNLNGKLAMRLDVELHVKVTGPMPDPGTYDNIRDAPMNNRTIELDAVVNMAFIVDTNTVFQNGTMAIKSSSIELIGSAYATLDLKNFPDLSDLANGSISYVSYHVELKFNVDVLLHLSFDPWLEVFHFPMSVGDSWDVKSNATLTGTVSGYLDVNGLPVSLEQMLFSETGLQELGFASFPIDFGQISFDGPPTVTNGVLQPISGNITATMDCVSATNLILPLYGDLVIYEIEVNGGPGRLYYSDDIKFLAQTNVSLPDIGLPSELSNLSTGMEPVDPATADQAIASISTYESTILTESNGGSTGSLDPILAIVIGVVIVFAGAVLLAVLVVKRRK